MDIPNTSLTLQPSDPACPNCGYTLVTPGPEFVGHSSSLPEILFGNRPPSQLEAKSIKSRLDEMKHDLSQLDVDIVRLQALLVSLTKKRDAISQFSQLHHGALSSIRHFPPEILAEVFQNLKRPELSVAYRPAQVCSFWRGVAYSTASLWTSFSMLPEEGKEQLELEIVQQWLSRSGALPITFFILHHDARPRPCIKLIATHSHRWKDANIMLPPSAMDELRGIDNNLPLLETISIRNSNYSDVASTDFPIADSLFTAPRLHTITLGSRPFGRMPKFPWGQLTTCNLEGSYTLAECYDMINNCYNLSSCQFTISEGVRSDITQRPVIIHPKIKKLRVEQGNCLDHLFNRLQLPAMVDFDHFDCDVGLSVYASITSLLMRSTPPLLRLHLNNPETTTHLGLIDCLQQCPLLEDLSLMFRSAFGVNAQFLRRLTHFPVETSRCLVPKLQKFEVAVQEYFNLEAFATFVQSRRRDHGQAMDHQNVDSIRDVTLCRDYHARAEDTSDSEDDVPPWGVLLDQLQDDGLLHAEDVNGYRIPLYEIVTGVPED